ncbi:melanocyte-stimulating hormone receptor-like [Porites lutea]|uniref:melanocyte-stimulating hormone receptor-like n=1 Tax=Porites lutea TaxID=51062 RepID=UPI003CC6BD12
MLSMEIHFEKEICLGTGISFMILSFLIVVPNGIVLYALYRNPLRCFRKAFSVFLAFISGVDFFIGTVVCIGETTIRFLCAFGDHSLPQEGDILRIIGYAAINSSILLVTAMSVDRFKAVVFPHFHLRKVGPRKLVYFNTAMIIFSLIFALLQLHPGISVEVYRNVDQYLHAVFPLSTSTLCYLGMFFVLRKQSSRIGLQRQTAFATPGNLTLQDMRRVKRAQMERKFATTSFFILACLILSLTPYFVAIIIAAHCASCGEQNWFFVLVEASVTFLFLNSAANPFLTAFRINELKKSVKIVLHVTQEGNRTNLGDFQLPPTSLRNSNFVSL